MSLFSLFSSSTNDQKTKSIKSSYTVFIANLRSVLEDPLSCEILLKNQYLGGNAVGSVNNNLTIGALDPSFFPHGPIAANWVSPNFDFIITQARLTTVLSSFRTLYLDKPGPNLLSYQVRVNFDIQVNGDTTNRQFLATGDVAKHPEYQIDLIADVDPTGQIYSCHGLHSKAEACELAGGAYDGSTDMNATPQLRCHPYLRCWIYQNGVSMTAAPPLPNPAIPPSCPWPYNTPSWIGRLGTTDVWLCQWCNNRLWTPGVN
ncbi:MAG: hypothetical protein ACXWRA_10195 [Pseudobdellovibrionaceae bacterium]